MLSPSKALLEKELQNSFNIHTYRDHIFVETLPTRLQYNHVFIFQQAVGTLQIDDRLYELSTKDLILIAKGQIYQFLPGSRVTCFELSFADSFWELAPASASNCKAVLFNNAAENQMLSLNQEDFIELYPLFKAMHSEFLKPDYMNKPDALAAYLKIMMIKMANVNAALANGYDDFDKKIFRRFKELISKNINTSHGVGEYATQLGISPRKLTGLCKRCSGKGAKDMIKSQIIAEAKRFLQFSTSPVKEIAYQLRFTTPEHFSHFFKKNAKVSPLDYRNHYVNIGM
jgi:AraC family transcriptional activator of pobA